MKMGIAEWILLVLLSMVWGGSYLFNAIAVESLPPLTIVALRLLTGALVLNIFSALRGSRLPADLRIWKVYVLMGLFNNVIPFSLIVWGQTRIAGGLASILNATTPLFTVLIAHRFTKDERLSASKISGLLIGFAGVVFIIGTGALSGFGRQSAAQIAVICASFSYASAGVFGRRLREMGSSPLAAATGQVSASALMLIPIVLIADKPWQLTVPPAAAVFSVLCLGLLSTALAYIIYFRILERAGATNLLLVTFLIPVHANILGILFRGEYIQAGHIWGMLLVFISLVLINRRSLARIGKKQ
jgi:drug/metabolite transporter (DMT)-like permease